MPLDGRLGSIGEQAPLTVSTISEDRPLYSGFASASLQSSSSAEPESPNGAGHPIALNVSTPRTQRALTQEGLAVACVMQMSVPPEPRIAGTAHCCFMQNREVSACIPEIGRHGKEAKRGMCSGGNESARGQGRTAHAVAGAAVQQGRLLRPLNFSRAPSSGPLNLCRRDSSHCCVLRWR